jgi:hypothetical protein
LQAGWLESAQVIIAVMGARGLMGVLGLTLVVLVLATSSLSTPAEATGALMFKKATKKKAASTSTKFKVGFYTGSCATVAKLDPTIIPALIRLFFHDCFANVSLKYLYQLTLLSLYLLLHVDLKFLSVCGSEEKRSSDDE